MWFYFSVFGLHLDYLHKVPVHLSSILWPRACLKIVNMPNRRFFPRHTALIWLEMHKVFLRQIALPGGKNSSPLGTLPFFKQRLTKEYGITPSMSRRGNCYDNAMTENFFSILKTECIYRQKIAILQQARQLIDDFICFYNHDRIQLKTGVAPLALRHST